MSTEQTPEEAQPGTCPKCGSQTPIGHRCIVDDLAAIRDADLSDHPLMQAIKGVAPQPENDYTPRELAALGGEPGFCRSLSPDRKFMCDRDAGHEGDCEGFELPTITFDEEF